MYTAGMAITTQDIKQRNRSGEIRYDEAFGHVCTCTEAVTYDSDGYPERASYLPTVTADRATATESGSYWYSCTRCGAGTWSGC